MNIAFSNQFEKQFDTITNLMVRKAISGAIKKIINATFLKEIPNVKKLKGHKNAYRIRVGDYRIGFFTEDDTIFIVTVLHRKDIYKRFP